MSEARGKLNEQGKELELSRKALKDTQKYCVFCVFIQSYQIVSFQPTYEFVFVSALYTMHSAP